MERDFPRWDELYLNNVDKLPWYYEKLDHDLAEELDDLSINEGRFLDLGTGPGTQAILLAKRGFKVTGTDLSPNAIERVKKISNDVNFIVDDILNSKLMEKSFDFIFDRGCLHVLSPEKRKGYVLTVKKILVDNGILFLKCFSIKEPMNDGPYRFSQNDILSMFGQDFEIKKIKETVYYGTLKTLPKALFVVMKNKEN